jgi:hypothetical protein
VVGGNGPPSPTAPASALPKRAGPLTLALVGFGIKAGAVPGHFWLPGAHAAAPSHISALLSGVMLKTGIYGLFRALILLGDPPAWWGWAVLLLGVASAVLGVLWALAQHDLKRLLAYHSVENIGIILMGLGVGALGATHHLPAVALLGYAGALLHTLNHALFKSLLFLSAGVVVQATGTREIDRLGGLARRMPGTALAFLVGAAAIVGEPPINGFVSEWLIFMGLVHAGRVGEGLQAAAALTAGLALTGALALACFSNCRRCLPAWPRRQLATPPGRRRASSCPSYLAALTGDRLLPLPARRRGAPPACCCCASAGRDDPAGGGGRRSIACLALGPVRWAWPGPHAGWRPGGICAAPPPHGAAPTPRPPAACSTRLRPTPRRCSPPSGRFRAAGPCAAAPASGPTPPTSCSTRWARGSGSGSAGRRRGCVCCSPADSAATSSTSSSACSACSSTCVPEWRHDRLDDPRPAGDPRHRLPCPIANCTKSALTGRAPILQLYADREALARRWCPTTTIFFRPRRRCSPRPCWPRAFPLDGRNAAAVPGDSWPRGCWPRAASCCAGRGFDTGSS